MKKDMSIDSGEVLGQWSAMNGVEVSRAIAVRDILVLGRRLTDPNYYSEMICGRILSRC